MTELFIRKASGLTRVISPKDALIYAWVNPGPVYAFIYIVWAGALYPGANMAWAVSMVLLLAPIMGLYYLFSISMPRSGGEYVYVSRGLHPALGFFSGWALTTIGITWSGQLTSWEVSYGIANLFYNQGILTNNAWLTNVGLMFNEVNSVTTFLVGLPIIILAFVVLWAGAKTVMRVSWACFVMSFIGLIAIVIASATSSQEFFVQRLRDLAGVDYNTLIQTASGQGMMLG